VQSRRNVQRIGVDGSSRIAGMKVFISYAGTDVRAAETVAAALSKRGLEPWIAANAKVGGELHKSVTNALEESDAMVVLVSPDAMRSQWVQSEIELALTTPRFKDRLIPLLVRPTTEGSIPWILNTFQITDLPTSPAGVERVVAQVVERLKAKGARTSDGRTTEKPAARARGARTRATGGAAKAVGRKVPKKALQAEERTTMRGIRTKRKRRRSA
jgi:hypothetical protein